MTKHLILTVLTATLANICAGQSLNDTIYYNKNWKKVNDKSSASFYRLYNASDTTEGRKPYRDYYISGKLQGEGTIVWEKGRMVEDGIQKNYYKNGKIHESWSMANGIHDAGDTTFHKNGKIKHTSYYGKDLIIKKQLLEEQEPTLKTLDFALSIKGERFSKLPIFTITPTVKNLTSIVDFSSHKFQKLMGPFKYYNKSPNDNTDLEPTYMIYNNIGSSKYAECGTNYIKKSKTQKHAQIYGELQLLFPVYSLNALKNELKPFYYDRISNGAERYVLNDTEKGKYIIDFDIIGDTCFQIDIRHLKTTKLISSIENTIDTSQKFTDIIFYNNNNMPITKEDLRASFYRLFNGRNQNDGLKPFREYGYSGITGRIISNTIWAEGFYTTIDTIGEPRLIENGEQKAFFSDGNILKKWYMKNGVKNGECIVYFNNETIKQKFFYKNGVIDGEYISYYKNGDIKRKNTYVDGLIVCGDSLCSDKSIIEVDTFYYDGNFMGEWVLKNGLIDGYKYTYYHSGNTETKTFYINGKKEGEEITYFDNGEIKRKSFYVNGKLEGQVIEYEQNRGKTTSYEHLFNYKDGELNGRQISYRCNNKDSIWCEDYFENGILQKEIRYNDDGSIQEIFSNIIFNDKSFTLNRTSFYSNDYSKCSIDYLYECLPSRFKKPFELYQIDADRFMHNGGHYYKHGKYQIFDRQNRILTEGQYTHESATGMWKLYNYENEVGYYRTVDYDNTHNVNRYYTLDNKPYSGTVTDYYSDSTKSIGSLKDGFRDGLWIHYEDNGEIINKINFKLGFAVGEGYFYYNDENIYQVINFDDSLTPRRFYTLDGAPYTGKHQLPIDKDEDIEADTIVYIINNSLITEEQYVNSKTGKIVKTTKYKNGLPIE
ncbi:MAG: hypothetical protein J6T70_20295 [Bacteroidales bacterium]|nr:hypothetical protein [Bacteroidales bacterium]